MEEWEADQAKPGRGGMPTKRAGDIKCEDLGGGYIICSVDLVVEGGKITGTK